MGPIGPHRMFGRPSDQPKEKFPKDIRKWPAFIFKRIKSVFNRLIYIYKIVWEANPFIILMMLAMSLFNGFQPVINAYIGKVVIDRLTLAAMGQLEDFSALIIWIFALVGFQFLIFLFKAIRQIITD